METTTRQAFNRSKQATATTLRTTVGSVLARHLTNLGVDPTLYSGQSLRAGWITTARANGVPDHLIIRHTRHRDTRMLTTYDRPTDLLPAASEAAGEWW